MKKTYSVEITYKGTVHTNLNREVTDEDWVEFLADKFRKKVDIPGLSNNGKFERVDIKYKEVSE
jgi:hypothetical protein